MPQTAVLHQQYRSGLKKQHFRVIPTPERLFILKDLILTLEREQELRWRQAVDLMFETYQENGKEVSKNMINAVLLVARRAEVVRTLKGKSLATAPVVLNVQGEKRFQEAVVRCDAAYLREILELPEPFDLSEAAIALYDSPGYMPYLQMVMSKWMKE